MESCPWGFRILHTICLGDNEEHELSICLGDNEEHELSMNKFYHVKVIAIFMASNNGAVQETES